MSTGIPKKRLFFIGAFFGFCFIITFYNEMVQSRFFLACFLHILLEDVILFS